MKFFSCIYFIKISQQKTIEPQPEGEHSTSINYQSDNRSFDHDDI